MGGDIDEGWKIIRSKTKQNNNLSVFSSFEGVDQNELNKDAGKAQIILQYDRWVANDQVKEDIASLLQTVSSKHKTLVYEEMRELGGGGWPLPSTEEVFHYALLFVVKGIALGILAEAGKDIYKKIVNELVQIRRKLTTNEPIALHLDIDGINSAVYIFQNSLTSDQAIDAFRLLKEHFQTIKNDVKNGRVARFFYDKNTKQWIPMD